jgi:hypothetical protein
MAKPTQLEDVSEAVDIAMYVEQVIAAENQWIMNRLKWLFTRVRSLALLSGPQNASAVCLAM